MIERVESSDNRARSFDWLYFKWDIHTTHVKIKFLLDMTLFWEEISLPVRCRPVLKIQTKTPFICPCSSMSFFFSPCLTCHMKNPHVPGVIEKDFPSVLHLVVLKLVKETTIPCRHTSPQIRSSYACVLVTTELPVRRRPGSEFFSLTDWLSNLT